MARKVGVLAVGVDRPGPFDPLYGAARDACAVAYWFSRQRWLGAEIRIELLVDAGGNAVMLEDVQDAMRRLVHAEDLHLLVLYFAGHGVVKSAGDTSVLVSQGKFAPSAVSVAATTVELRRLRCPHVILIVDACRTTSESLTLRTEPALYRDPNRGVKRPKLDTYYSSLPSEKSKEIQAEGVFTKVLLNALWEQPAPVIEAWESVGRVITPWGLETYLDEAVADFTAAAVPPFDQEPDMAITSRSPLFFGFGDASDSVPKTVPAPGKGLE